jgi:biotin transport system substrate-specific component
LLFWTGEEIMQTSLPVRVSTPQNLFGVTTTRAGRIVLAFSASALMAVCAHVSFPLFFTPVPLTMQTFAVLLSGILLGPSMAFSSMLLYLAEGAAGLPVFSPAGPGGLAQLLGVTGGYLMAYPFAAALAGLIVRALAPRWSRFGAALAAGSTATLLVLVSGGLWMSVLSHAAWGTSVIVAIVPFLPGEVIKIAAAAGIYASLRRYVRH